MVDPSYGEAHMRSSTARRHFGAFVTNEHGNVATMFGLALIPVLGLAGAALDYSNATRTQADLQGAVDGAALAGVPHLKKPDSEVRDVVRKYLDANLDPALRGNPFEMEVRENRTTLLVRMSAEVKNSFTQIIGTPTTTVRSSAEARRSTDNAEIVLALDTTGTMRPHMPALRQAAKDLIKTVYERAGAQDAVKLALVPYVTAVNLGPHANRMQWMDVAGDSKFHGENFENVKFYDRRCDPPPPVVAQPKPKPQPRPETVDQDPKPPAVPRPRPPSPPSSPDLGSADDLLPKSRMAGVGEAVQWAATATARTGLNLLLDALRPSSAHARSGSWPYGNVNGPPDCSKQLSTPSKVNHFDLFAALEVPWKGCIEARPYPYDVTDERPSTAKPDTLFVPYFWPDESESNLPNVRNTYLSDKAAMPGWVKNTGNGPLKQAWIWKYNEGSKPKIDEVSFLTTGPNAACPDPIVPLTNNRAKLTGALDSLRAYAASGTNIGEGLAWAWRVVSPSEPFTEGAPYGPTNKKYIVLMTDGFNEVVPQNVSWNKSDYTSVGYAAKGRLGTTDRDAMTKVLDKRLAEVCTNIKAAGIQIFTVLYDPVGRNGNSQVEDLLKACSTSPKTHAYKASSQADLVNAFQRIAGEISALRLSR